MFGRKDNKNVLNEPVKDSPVVDPSVIERNYKAFLEIKKSEGLYWNMSYKTHSGGMRLYILEGTGRDTGNHFVDGYLDGKFDNKTKFSSRTLDSIISTLPNYGLTDVSIDLIGPNVVGDRSRFSLRKEKELGDIYRVHGYMIPEHLTQIQNAIYMLTGKNEQQIVRAVDECISSYRKGELIKAEMKSKAPEVLKKLERIGYSTEDRKDLMEELSSENIDYSSSQLPDFNISIHSFDDREPTLLKDNKPGHPPANISIEMKNVKIPMETDGLTSLVKSIENYNMFESMRIKMSPLGGIGPDVEFNYHDMSGLSSKAPILSNFRMKGQNVSEMVSTISDLYRAI